jgi:glycosyltransferase involved in cell wall biosynthesis
MSDSSTGTGKQRLLFISRKWPPAIGGMETYSVELAASLRERFEVDTLVLPGKPSGSPPGLLSYGAFVLKALFQCLTRGRRYPFLVLGDPLLFPAALVHYLVARSSRRFVVVYGLDLVYGTRPGLLPFLYSLYLSLLVRCQSVFDGVVAISRYTAELAGEAGLNNVVVIHPSLPDSPLTRARDSLEDVTPLFTGFARVVLCFGRLVPRKGAIWFAQHVLPKLPADVGLIVAGPATKPDQVALLQSLSRVNYIGSVPAATLSALIRAADVVAMPNIRTPGAADVEGFGLVAIETSSLGGRLLASRLDGISDAVIDGVTGVLVEPGDSEAWAEAVEKSLMALSTESPDHRNEVAIATRAAYSRTVQAEAFYNLLLETTTH